MSNAPQGLLFVLGQCNAEDLTDFNDWYDHEHAPARLTVPGITSATRYKATDDQNPEWLAIYDMAIPETLKDPAYVALREAESATQSEKTLFARLPALQRRIYSLVASSTKEAIPRDVLPGKYLLVVIWSVKEEFDTEFHRWYDEEHTEMIARIPGWLRGRRYKLNDGMQLAGDGPPINGWNYLVMHEFDRDRYLETEECKNASNTPWSVKMMGNPNMRVIIRHFALYKDFQKP